MYVVIHYRFQLQIIVEYKYENVNYFDGKCNGLIVNNVDLFPTPILLWNYQKNCKTQKLR